MCPVLDIGAHTRLDDVVERGDAEPRPVLRMIEPFADVVIADSEPDDGLGVEARKSCGSSLSVTRPPNTKRLHPPARFDRREPDRTGNR